MHAESSGDGVLITKFASFPEALRLRDLLLRKGLAPGAASIPSQHAFLMFLPNLTLDEFAELIEGADVELI
jgi:hypothetical protein